MVIYINHPDPATATTNYVQARAYERFTDGQVNTVIGIAIVAFTRLSL